MNIFNGANGGFSSLVSSLVTTFLQASPQIIAVHLLSSVTVMVFIVYFFWKPTNSFIVKQKEKLDQAHNSLAEITKETRTALTNLQAKQKELVEEKDRFFLERREKEKLLLEKKLEEAEKMKIAIVKEAANRAKQLEEEAKRTINEKIITLSIGLTEKLIKSSLNEGIQNKVINSYLDEIDTVFQKDVCGRVQLEK